eukprot:GHUV01034353.1.p1 GENE.GHUV01034353.1~~GHUV01034353.1.p1  ORF type:complete len:217 (+),score=31.85 GHUV01034353.1:1337-1987(+)
MQPGCRLCNAFNLPTHLCRRPARPAVPPRSTRGCWSQQPQYQVRRCIHRLPHSTLQSSCSHLQQQLSAMVDATAAKTGTLKPVWLDCDPGHDDAMAIILAGYSPALKLLGISTVASNQVVEKTTRNALDVLDLCGLSHVGTRHPEQFGRQPEHIGDVLLSRQSPGNDWSAGSWFALQCGAGTARVAAPSTLVRSPKPSTQLLRQFLCTSSCSVPTK